MRSIHSLEFPVQLKKKARVCGWEALIRAANNHEKIEAYDIWTMLVKGYSLSLRVLVSDVSKGTVT